MLTIIGRGHFSKATYVGNGSHQTISATWFQVSWTSEWSLICCKYESYTIDWKKTRGTPSEPFAGGSDRRYSVWSYWLITWLCTNYKCTHIHLSKIKVRTGGPPTPTLHLCMMYVCAHWTPNTKPPTHPRKEEEHTDTINSIASDGSRREGWQVLRLVDGGSDVSLYVKTKSQPATRKRKIGRFITLLWIDYSHFHKVL